MTTSGAVLVKAGANVSSTMTADAGLELEQFISEAESYINAVTRLNYSDGYAALDADVKHILNMVASAKAAMLAISYDMGGYTSRFEAETMLDVLNDEVLKGISLLKDKKTTTFIDGA